MNSVPDSPISTGDVNFTVRGAIGLIVLNRMEALNALTHPMCIAIDRQLVAWSDDPDIAAVVVASSGERAFCAGGDVRALYEAGIALRDGRPEGRIARDFIRDEYRLNRRIRNWRKPYIALIDGLTMGGGFGISVHGSYRVATDRTVFAMPETAIGLFPDVGATYVLPRLPRQVGAYLGLTGMRIKAADMIALGLVTHYVQSSRIPALLDDLVSAEWGDDAHDVADRVIGTHAIAAGDGEIMPHLDQIEHCFGHDEVSDILAALDRADSALMATAATRMRAMSPSSLKLTLAANRRGRHLEFDDCMVMEYRLIQSALLQHDFYEGVRAHLIDKDRQPKWLPAVLDAVDAAMLDRYFVAPPPGDLSFVD